MGINNQNNMANLDIEPSLMQALNKTFETAVSKKMNSVLESIVDRYGKGGTSFTVEDLLEQFDDDVQIDNGRVVKNNDEIYEENEIITTSKKSKKTDKKIDKPDKKKITPV